MTNRRHYIFWAAAFALALGIIYILGSVLLPFVLGMAVAYLLNPLMRKMCRTGLSRRAAALLMLGWFALVVLILALLLLPPLYHEILDLVNNIPAYLRRLQDFMRPSVNRIQAFLDAGNHGEPADMQAMIGAQAGSAAHVAKGVLLGVFAGGQAALHLVSVILVTPIAAYFMMKEWDHITAWVKDLLPLRSKAVILDLAAQIDAKLGAFIRGQLGVMFVLGLGYAVLLSIAGLKYGFLIGFATGLLSIIPMVGTSIGFIAAVATAFFQTGGDWMYVGIIAGIFIAGQVIEGNVLTPFLVGKSVGLHPLWILFALMVGAGLFGILGMLLAVPVAASASVLLCYALERYKASPYYKRQEL